MSRAFTLGVMMLFLQGINLLALLISPAKDFTQISVLLQLFMPGIISIACFGYHFLVENKKKGR